METLTLEFTIDEANTILAALGQQPYVKVVGLIRKIQGEGSRQLQTQSQPVSAAESVVESEALNGVEHG